MTGHIHSSPGGVATTTAPDPLAPQAVEVTRIVVALDGSPFAERALPVAFWTAGMLGADLQLIEVVTSDEAAEGAIRYLDNVGRRHHAAWDVLQHHDAARAILDAVARTPGAMVCLATHGRDRTAALVGSVAISLLDRSGDPVLLAGPHARPVVAGDAPVVVAAGGTGGDETLVQVALGWAERFGRRLLIVTVGEPAAPSLRMGAGWRAQTAGEAAAHVAALADQARACGVPVDSRVIESPANPHSALVSFVDRSAALVVVGSRGRPGTVLGSQAARIIHDASVATLAVPLTGAPAA